ncbi:MAG: hypothetical protein TREMPRED_003027 [Tremellales sp. Tagirdzhanova-0007]|nr:MAG: hypothetical protein TREMPRED_003027 [Tremellales sp. Tagirdzhanova-0007]
MSTPERNTGPPEWQNLIRSRLMVHQVEGETYRDIIQQYRRLAKTARELKIRNRALLRGGVGPSSGSDGSPNPLLAHLDAQLTHLRSELSTLYRTQAAAQNKQLSLSDALRDRDEEVRGLREEVRELRETRDAALRKERDWDERWKMRTKDMETLNDEVITQNIEISALTQRNTALQADNSGLLQRWLDKMNLTAEEMNVEFENETSIRGDQAKNKGKEKEGFQSGEKV